MATQNAVRTTREARFESPTVRKFVDEESIPARVHRQKQQEQENDTDSHYASESADTNVSAAQNQTARHEKGETKKNSLLRRRVKRRVAFMCCAIFSGGQSLFATLAAATIILLPIGLTFWLISVLCALAGFTAIFIVFKDEILGNAGLMMLAVSMAILSIVPFLNVIPWMGTLVWILYADDVFN